MNRSTQPQSGTTGWERYGKYRSRIVHRERIAKHVNLYVVEKPDGFEFRPGQAVDLAIDEERWRDDKHPFTITSLPNNPRLEFVIKSYPLAEHPDHSGMTEHLGNDIQVNDRVIFGDAWGAIQYRGPGVFIAGGAGITPFIAILRQLEQQGTTEGNRLFASHRAAAEVILQGEFARMLGPAAVFTLTDEEHRSYEHGRIDRQWLVDRVDDFDQPFYLCGPPPMIDELSETLKSLGVLPGSMVVEDDS